MFTSPVRLLGIAVCFVAACYNPELAPGHFACVGAADCPAHLVCVKQLCVAPPDMAAAPGEPSDCLHLKQLNPGAPSGEYVLWPKAADAPFSAYCDMTSEGGGWTLVIKVSGSRSTFAYSSNRWTTPALFNPEQADLDDSEAKLQSYNTVPFNEVRLSLRVGATTRSLNLRTALAPSMLARMQGGYVATDAGRAAWKGLLEGSSLQPNCNREGFNVNPQSSGDYSRARLGIIANEQGDCSSPDSGLGIGLEGKSCAAAVSAGNAAGCNADNGTVTKPAMGYLFVRQTPGG